MRTRKGVYLLRRGVCAFLVMIQVTTGWGRENESLLTDNVINAHKIVI